VSQVSENQIQSALPHTLGIVKEPLQQVEQMLAQQMQSDVPIIDEMVRCGAVTGGKRFRPILLFLAAHANGGVRERQIMLATAVEMIHAATLVHDDIIDEADTRRHVTTINKRWGNQGAVLFGDFLFTQAFYLASLTGSAKACQIIGEATNQVCEGELQQSDCAGNFETSIKEYYQIISRKTASLCGCATQLGGLTDDDRTDQAWQEVGLKLGLAFQIIDDVLDYTGDAATCGKTLGTDLQTSKPTLPILLALEACSESRKLEWMDRLSQRTTSFSEVQDWLRATGSIEASVAKANLLIKEATQFTNQQNPEVAKAFAELGAFLLARTM